MQKHLKRFVIVSILSLLLVQGASVYAEVDSAPLPTDADKSKLELIENNTKVKDIDIEPLNTDKIKNIIPDTRQEGRKVIGLFLKTMAAVLLSAAFLFIVLYFFKKIRGIGFRPQQSDIFETFDLSTPDNKQDALNSFLNRSK